MKRRVKDLIKRVLRPLLARLDDRVDARVDIRLGERIQPGELESYRSAIAALGERVDVLDRYLPAVLDTAESRSAAEREIGRALDDLRADVDRLQDLVRAGSGTVVDA